MLFSEYEKLIGGHVTFEEYAEANEVYMNCDLDKVEFCKCWKVVRNNKLFLNIHQRYTEAMTIIKYLEEYAIY